MKPDSNIEIDRLLHRFARRPRDESARSAPGYGVASVGAGQEHAGGTEHLDADELIAYAENALPVATRTRYAGHLSECDSCRKQVTDLVLSSGVAVQLETQGQTKALPQTPSWRNWLAAMFAPRALRYAATVLLLAGITAIGFIVFRGGRELRFNTSPTSSENGSVNTGTAEPTSPNKRVAQDKNSGVQTPSRSGEEGSKSDDVDESPVRALKDAPQEGPMEAQKSGQEQAEGKPAPPVTTGVLSGGRAAARDEDFKADDNRQPTYGEDSAVKRKVSKEVDREESSGQVASEARSRSQTDESVTLDGVSNADKNSTKSTNARPAAKSSARRGDSAPAAPAAGTPNDVRKTEVGGTGAAEESRLVSGRHFVRRGSAWIDVAYRSQATTNVKRGSDQYRALVADEPGLRAVADQLGGNVIVVWKGRAYRIH